MIEVNGFEFNQYDFQRLAENVDIVTIDYPHWTLAQRLELAMCCMMVAMEAESVPAPKVQGMENPSLTWDHDHRGQ